MSRRLVARGGAIAVAVGAFAAVLVGRVRPESEGPRSPGDAARPEASARASEPGAGAAIDEIRATGERAPRDVKAEVATDADGSLRVVVRRPGHLVSLRARGARAAGEDWAALHLTPAAAGIAAVDLVWESTRLDTLATVRGTAHVAAGADGHAAVTLAMAEPPRAAGHLAGAHHACDALHDGWGGFTVLCRLDASARRAGAASAAGSPEREDVWVTASPSASTKGRSRAARRTVTRLDLPLEPGASAARLVGYVAGAEGFVIRADASWVRGEAAASLSLTAAAARQPSFSF